MSTRNFAAIATDCVAVALAVRNAGRKRRMLRFWRTAWTCFLRLRSNKPSACCANSNGLWRCKCKRGSRPAPCAKCHARGFACGRIGARELFRTTRFICAGACVRQAPHTSPPRGPAPAHVSDDCAHSIRTCGDFPGLVCAHLHSQRRLAQ